MTRTGTQLYLPLKVFFTNAEHGERGAAVEGHRQSRAQRNDDGYPSPSARRGQEIATERAFARPRTLHPTVAT